MGRRWLSSHWTTWRISLLSETHDLAFELCFGIWAQGLLRLRCGRSIAVSASLASTEGRILWLTFMALLVPAVIDVYLACLYWKRKKPLFLAIKLHLKIFDKLYKAEDDTGYFFKLYWGIISTYVLGCRFYISEPTVAKLRRTACGGPASCHCGPHCGIAPFCKRHIPALGGHWGKWHLS